MAVRDVVIKYAWAMFNVAARVFGDGESKHADKDVNELIVEEVFTHIPHQPGDRILDIGCGSGFIVERLARHGRLAVGLDFVNRFPGHGTGIYVQGDARTLPFADDSFDHIICYGVLHYLGDKKVIQDTLSDYVRTLKPQGTLFLGEIIQKRGYFNKYITAAKMPLLKKIALLAYLNSFLYQYYHIPRSDWDAILSGLPVSTLSVAQNPSMPYHANMRHLIIKKLSSSKAPAQDLDA